MRKVFCTLLCAMHTAAFSEACPSLPWLEIMHRQTLVREMHRATKGRSKAVLST